MKEDPGNEFVLAREDQILNSILARLSQIKNISTVPHLSVSISSTSRQPLLNFTLKLLG